MTKLLFITQRPFYPDSSGGGQHSALYLLNSLRQLGWQIEIICARKFSSSYFWHACWQFIKSLEIPFPLMMDKDFGYPCWRLISEFNNKRTWLKFLEQRLLEYKPDIVLGHCDPQCILLNYSRSKGFQSIYIARCTDHFEAGVVVPDDIPVLANSPFAASVIAKVSHRKAEVVLPFIESKQYQVSNRQRQYITFINPIPHKGINIAIEIARLLPQENFLFVKGKSVAYKGKQEYFLKPVYKLPNVKVWEHQQDMRHVYEVTDILLVPSQYNETFGRVIVEAQINSIPVVAADVGGISYTLGKGGILVKPADKLQVYVDALQQLRSNSNFYAEKSALAFQNSQRLEFNPQYQVQKFIQFVQSCIPTKVQC